MLMKKFTMKTSVFILSTAVILCGATMAHAEWSGDVSLSYSQTSGNTDKGSGLIGFNTSHKMTSGEFLGKAKAFYSQSNNKMDGQKWDALAKYLLKMPDESRWFTSYQIGVDHDRFTDVDYRIAPAIGLGYHFAQEDDWTWNADIALGYEITRYRVNTNEDDETVVLIGHTFAKKRILKNAFISQDLTVIPGLESGAGVRVKSETAFTNPLNEQLDLEIKYIVDYDSEASPGKTSTDKQILAGIKYKF
jgi:putative salt-induced outer membrane protein YdiY